MEDRRYTPPQGEALIRTLQQFTSPVGAGVTGGPQGGLMTPAEIDHRLEHAAWGRRRWGDSRYWTQQDTRANGAGAAGYGHPRLAQQLAVGLDANAELGATVPTSERGNVPRDGSVAFNAAPSRHAHDAESAVADRAFIRAQQARAAAVMEAVSPDDAAAATADSARDTPISAGPPPTADGRSVAPRYAPQDVYPTDVATYAAHTHDAAEHRGEGARAASWIAPAVDGARRYASGVAHAVGVRRARATAADGSDNGAAAACPYGGDGNGCCCGHPLLDAFLCHGNAKTTGLVLLGGATALILIGALCMGVASVASPRDRGSGSGGSGGQEFIA